MMHLLNAWMAQINIHQSHQENGRSEDFWKPTLISKNDQLDCIGLRIFALIFNRMHEFSSPFSSPVNFVPSSRVKVLKLRFILSPPLAHFSHIFRTYTVFIGWKMASVSVKRADVSRGSPSSSLWRWAKARNVSFKNSLRWPIYIINSVDKTRLSCYTPLLTLHHCFFR